MQEIARPADFTFPGAYFKRGSAELHCMVETELNRTARLRPAWSEEELRTGYVVHFALQVSSLDVFREVFARQGIEPIGGPRIRADGVEQIYIADPDGYVVELMCFHDEAAAKRRRAELTASGEGVPIAPGYEQS
jgi:glyoxylase I family protein